MFTLYDNIKRLCDLKGVSPSKMCLDIGKTKSLISALKTGRTTGINESTAVLMAEYFGVSVDEVLHGIKEDRSDTFEKLQEVRDEQRILLQVTDDMSGEQINRIVDMIKGFKGDL